MHHTAAIEKEKGKKTHQFHPILHYSRNHEDTQQCRVREINTKANPFHELPRFYADRLKCEDPWRAGAVLAGGADVCKNTDQL
jgi:hypothetical protein